MIAGFGLTSFHHRKLCFVEPLFESLIQNLDGMVTKLLYKIKQDFKRCNIIQNFFFLHL